MRNKLEAIGCIIVGAALLLTGVAFFSALAQRDAARAKVQELRQQIEELENREPYVLVIEKPEAEADPETAEAEADADTPVRENRATEPVGNTDEFATDMDVLNNDVDLLARLIYREIGSDAHPDEQLYNVGSVVINRVNSDRFPDTLREVIYEPGQYAPAIDGSLETAIPTQRCYDIAADLLENGSVIPEDVVWQSGGRQGSEVWATYYSPVTGITTYYCR